MTTCRHGFALKGLFICAAMVPAAWGAASGCVSGELLGLYNAQITNINMQDVLQSMQASASSAAATDTARIAGFAANDNSLSGNLPALGRYYFDGAGNIVGVSTGRTPFNLAIGKYTVSADCTGKVTLTSGAAYDFVLSNSGRQVTYLRTDTSSGGNVGVLRRAASCVGLSYPSSFTFAVAGGSKQADSSGAFGPYSAIGVMNLTGSTGQFNMTETLYKSSGVVRSTASGTYTVGVDCSVSFKFSTSAGANSSNFVAPASFRALMQDSSNGLLVLQPDANTTLTGTLTAQ